MLRFLRTRVAKQYKRSRSNLNNLIKEQKTPILASFFCCKKFNVRLDTFFFSIGQFLFANSPKKVDNVYSGLLDSL